MGMAAIFINGPWPFEQTFNTPVTEGSTWILKKTGVTEEKSFKRVDRRTDDEGRRTASDHNSLSWAVLKWAKKKHIFLKIGCLPMSHKFATKLAYVGTKIYTYFHLKFPF